MTSPAPAAGAAGPPDHDVRAAQRGDRRAFERLYRAHVGRVHAVCVRMCGGGAEAEERTQDAFVRAWEKLPQFRGESAFTTWMHRLTVNVVLNARGGARRQRAAAEGGDALDAVAAPAAPAGLALDLEQAIAALPPGARRVFTLFDVLGFTHEEIAHQLGITTGGSKAQLHRARLLLREALAR